MKRIVLCIVILAVIVGGVLWRRSHPGAAKPAEATPAADEAAGPKIERDAEGHIVIKITDEVQGSIGLKVEKLQAAQFSPELKGYGQVVDPAPLAALLTELGSARASYLASSNELARLKVLAGQGNTSARALRTAEAAALRDQLAVKSARDRLALTWGAAVADRDD